MPGFPTAPAVQTITDKLATIAPELGNVAGYYVYLKDPIAGTIYESATATDGAGNWSITGVTMGLTYQYSYGKHPNTAYPFQGAYVASNPASHSLGTGGVIYDKGGMVFNAKAYNAGALNDTTISAAVTDAVAQLGLVGFVVYCGSGEWDIFNPVVYPANVGQHGVQIRGAGKFGTRFYLAADLAFGRAMFEMKGPTTVVESWQLGGCRILGRDRSKVAHLGVGVWTRYTDEPALEDVWFQSFAMSPAIVHGYKTTEFNGRRVHFDECAGFDRNPTAVNFTTLTDTLQVPGQIETWSPSAWVGGKITFYGGTSTVFAGTATGGSATSLIDTGRAWSVGALGGTGYFVRFRNADGYSQTQPITSNTATQLNFAAAETNAQGVQESPAAGTIYEIVSPSLTITANTGTTITYGAGLQMQPDVNCVYKLTGPMLYANANGSDWAVQVHGTDLAGTLQTSGAYTGNTAPQFIGDHIKYLDVNGEDGHGGFFFVEDKDATNFKLEHGWIEDNYRSQQPYVMLKGPQWPNFHDMTMVSGSVGFVTCDRDAATNQTRQPKFFGCTFRRPQGGDSNDLVGGGGYAIKFTYAIDASVVASSFRVCSNGDMFATAANTPRIHLWGNSSDWVSQEPGRKMHCVVDTGNPNVVYQGEVNGGLVINGVTGFSGNLLELLTNAVSKFSVDGAGLVTMPGTLNFAKAATAAGSGGAPTLPANTPNGGTGGAGKWMAVQLNGGAGWVLIWQ